MTAATTMLRQEYELLNDDLYVTIRRVRGGTIVEQIQMHAFIARHRHAAGELVPRNERSSGPHGGGVKRREGRAAQGPFERVRQPSGRRLEPEHICGDELRLHDELHVLVSSVAPAADL